MTEIEYVPLISALVGAVIGSLTSIGTIYIQQRAQSKRDRSNQIINAATKQFELAIEVAKIRGSGEIPPYAVFLHHHYELFKLLEKDELNEEALKNILGEDT